MEITDIKSCMKRKNKNSKNTKKNYREAKKNQKIIN